MSGKLEVCSDRGALPEDAEHHSTNVSETEVHAYASAYTPTIDATPPFSSRAHGTKTKWIDAHAKIYTGRKVS
jgi:hypothetical protein